MMESIFIRSIRIDRVTHLENIDINVCDCECKNIIITGKNGSGKTILLDSIATFINSVTLKDDLDFFNERYKNETAGIWLEFNKSFVEIKRLFEAGKFVTAYHKADRVFSSIEPEHVEKVKLKTGYSINDTPRKEFIKYLLDLKMTQALAISNGKLDKADNISKWFNNFDNLLKQIFDDESVRVDFDEDTFKFSIEIGRAHV